MTPVRDRPTAMLLYLGAAIVVAPLLLMALTALRPDDDIVGRGILSLPARISLDGVSESWRLLRGHFLQSMTISLPVVLVSVGLGAAAGAALAIQPDTTSRTLSAILLVGLFVPPQVVLYPMIVATRTVGLFGSLPGLILVHTVWGLPLTTLLFRNYFATLPRRVVDAARIDGADFVYFFRRVAAPSAWPVVAVAATLQFTYVWNDMLLGVTFGGRGVQPITVALMGVGGGQFGPQHPGLSMAAALVAALPPLICFGLAARFLASQLSRGGSA